jgi:dihydrofolate reductase
MRRLMVFENVTMDGYFTDAKGDMSWAHQGSSPDWEAFTTENAKGGGEMLFGRITYDLMKSYWPTPAAAKDNPVVAEQMNSLPKVVFSKSLDKASWSNTKVVKGDLAAEVRRMKKEPGRDMVIMGSGTIVSQLAPAGVIDEYQVVVHPLVLGKGRTLFEGVTDRLAFKVASTRTFSNGNVLLSYEPA